MPDHRPVPERHARLAAGARELLADLRAWDPSLDGLDPATLHDPARAAAAQRLLAYLAQPFVVAEPVTGLPGEHTSLPHLLDAVEDLLDGA